jgi:steroid 5-alpha reductase family enzyme
MASASGAWIPALCLAHVFGAVVYGLRLGGFLYWRSLTWSEWGKRAQNAPEAKAKSIVAKIPVVLLCSLLYACMCSPILWHAKVANAIPGGYLPVVITGVGMQWLGAALEAAADHQKSAYKATDAGKTRWCDAGVYARCRHPNYLGELAFWFGTFLAGVPAMLVAGAGSFLPAALGLVFIAKLMTSQCGKQDEKQAGRYGEQKAYREWVANSGSLFPKMA